MFVEQATREDTRYGIRPPTVVDAEGSAVDPQPDLAYEVTSTDATVVEILPDDDNELAGTVHFGAPGIASVNVVVKDAETGDVVGSFGAQFTLVPGDPAAVVGGGISFEGLTEVEPQDPDA